LRLGCILPSKDEIDFQSLAENSVDIICRARLDYSLEYVSPSCVRILGWTRQEMMDAPPLGFMVPEDAHLVDEAIVRAAASGGPFSFVTLRMRRKVGSPVWMEVTSNQVLDPVTGELTGFVTVLRDISERKRFEERLTAQALTDGLTGLANRRSFDDTLDREWKRTLREGSQLSLLLVDIDHFKSVNDRYGHQVGDDYLRVISAAVCGAVRSPDTVARYGGEEIAVILPGAGSEGAVETGERVRIAIKALRLTHTGNPLSGEWVTASVGAATALARQGGTIRMPESLLLAADNALYKAKQGGRNRVETAVLVAPKD
jgi:diguanylate cyclase (GGDEF)-like protein/PAS domain S-box-containing protein